MNIRKTFAALTACTFIAAGASANAASYTQITDPGAISALAATETFEGFTVGTTLPLTSGIMSLSSTNPNGVAVVSGSIAHPGTPGGSQWVGNSGDADSYSFDFTSAISQFGLVMYGHQFTGTTMGLYDESDQLLASFLLAAPGAGSSQYVGFTADTANVRSVDIVFGGVDAVWIDNVSYLDGSMSAVPLPATLPMLLAGLGVVAAAARRRKAG